MFRNLALRAHAIRAVCNVISISVYGTLHVGQSGTSGVHAFLGIHNSDKQFRVNENMISWESLTFNKVSFVLL